MAKKEFILQGPTPATHLAAVRQALAVPEVLRVLIGVAFISEPGVDQIKEQLSDVYNITTIFAGIRNDITSRQGLARLFEIGCRLYTVDTGSRSVLFHPKIFLARGKARARLILGSANLTLGGLNNNIEAGLSLDFDLADAADKSVVDSIEAQFDALPDDYPSHVIRIVKAATLDAMFEDGLVIDETAPPPPKPATAAKGPGKHFVVPRIRLAVRPLYRSALKGAAPPKKPKPVQDAEPAPAIGVDFEFVWQSKPLTHRDLTIPPAPGTHKTGSMNLDRGVLAKAVDHRHYFRENVFPTLAWAPASATTEKAYAKFHLVLGGVSQGEFDLRVGHTMGTDSRGYLQGNAMTRLSWGPMRPFIARPEYIGMTLSLYRDRAEPNRFLLEFD